MAQRPEPIGEHRADCVVHSEVRDCQKKGPEKACPRLIHSPRRATFTIEVAEKKLCDLRALGAESSCASRSVGEGCPSATAIAKNPAISPAINPAPFDCSKRTVNAAKVPVANAQKGNDQRRAARGERRGASDER